MGQCKCGNKLWFYETQCLECKRKEQEKRPKMTFTTSGREYQYESKLIGKFTTEVEE